MSKEPPLIPADTPSLDADKFFQEFYLEFRNNFLTTEGIAEHYQINVVLAQELISKGRLVHIRVRLTAATLALREETK